MQDPLALRSDARRILALARRDRAAAGRAMEGLSLEEQVAVVCDAPVQRRAELLDLAPAPERLIPVLPEAEFCFTVKAIGIESATWILEYATPEQLVASLDLDAWSGHVPDRAGLDTWLDALAETSDPALLRSVDAIDPELLALYLRGRVAVIRKPEDDEGWQPPQGAQTLEGQFYFVALRENDDVAAVLRLLHLLFSNDYWTYFRMMQAVIWELESENQEWARRWRIGRLEDLGFPPWEEAMSLYGYLRPEQRAAIGDAVDALDISEWHLPVWMTSLPEGRDSRHSIFRTIAKLSAEERRAAFFAFVAIANKVAVADQMDLSDAETTPKAIEKAAVWISKGLEHVAAENALDATHVMRRVPLERLFRVGANLDPERARESTRPESANEANERDERGRW
jgi:hypothetical protein